MIDLAIIPENAYSIGLIAGLGYILLLYLLGRNDRVFPYFMGACVFAIICVNATADYHVIDAIAQHHTNKFSAVVLAIFHSLELFVFHTHFFDNGYQEFFFGKGPIGSPAYTDEGIYFVYIFTITFILACISSVALVIRAFSRRRAGRTWLALHKRDTHGTHIFFLGDDVAVQLAEDIRANDPGAKIVYVGYPDPEESYMDLSVWEKIKRLFKRKEEGSIAPFSAIIYSRIQLKDAIGNRIFKDLGINDLSVFLKDETSKVYLLTDNESDNLRCADLLTANGCESIIYCRASREGINRMYENMLTSRENAHVKLIDSSYLAVRGIKDQPDLLPVNVVNKGKDSQGRLEGWVSSTFNSMVLGFGEMGREALGFIYEHAAFVDKNFKKSRFSCLVIDKNMDKLRESYQKEFPGMNAQAGITFKQCEVGSNDFWTLLDGKLPRLNYLIICLGNDQLNLTTAIEIEKLAYQLKRKRPENLSILVSLVSPSDLDKKTLAFYNDSVQYKDLIKPFGGKDLVWTINNITNSDLDERARRFSYNYEMAQGKSAEEADSVWTQYNKDIKEGTDFAVIADAIRRRSQNYANCFHMATKRALIGPEIDARLKEIAEEIPARYETHNAHYLGADEHIATVLHYLAVLEHVRWEASHVAMGYKPGKEGEPTDVILKTHACIKDYEALAPGTKHYDYLVVKTTFELL